MLPKRHKSLNFLVDVNLPKKFKFFNSPNFTHVVDINPQMTDDEIWNYAIEKDKVIITKDADFYDRFMYSENAPKVIYIRLGNITLKELHLYFEKNWDTIITHLDKTSLVIAKKDCIQVIE